jgi:hypothetical protein
MAAKPGRTPSSAKRNGWLSAAAGTESKTRIAATNAIM